MWHPAGDPGIDSAGSVDAPTELLETGLDLQEIDQDEKQGQSRAIQGAEAIKFCRFKLEPEDTDPEPHEIP